MSPLERKRLQRQRDKLAGWAEVTLKVSAARVPELRAFAASLPPPEPPTDPRQMELLAEIERWIGPQP